MHALTIPSLPVLLGGSWVVISGVISRITIVITRIRGLITLLITTHEHPSTATTTACASSETTTSTATLTPTKTTAKTGLTRMTATQRRRIPSYSLLLLQNTSYPALHAPMLPTLIMGSVSRTRKAMLVNCDHHDNQGTTVASSNRISLACY